MDASDDIMMDPLSSVLNSTKFHSVLWNSSKMTKISVDFQMESLKPYVVPNHLADFAAVLTVMSFATSSEPSQLQAILEERDIPRRLELSLELLKKEFDIINLQQKYGAEAEEKVNVNQRRWNDLSPLPHPENILVLGLPLWIGSDACSQMVGWDAPLPLLWLKDK